MNEIDDEYDFDKWMQLYKKDPDSFERKRVKIIQSTINQAPKTMHRRLTGLQWRIDSEIKLAKTPLAGCIKVYQMMMDSIYEEDGLLDALTSTKKELKKTTLHIVNIKGVIHKHEKKD